MYRGKVHWSDQLTRQQQPWTLSRSSFWIYVSVGNTSSRAHKGQFISSLQCIFSGSIRLCSGTFHDYKWMCIVSRSKDSKAEVLFLPNSGCAKPSSSQGRFCVRDSVSVPNFDLMAWLGARPQRRLPEFCLGRILGGSFGESAHCLSSTHIAMYGLMTIQW